MSPSVLLVDGRVLNDDHPGVRRFWVPILRAWADLGGRGLVAHRRGLAPEAALTTAGFSVIELRHGPYDPRGVFATRSVVRRSGATATLSPLYLTLDGAARNVGTVFDLAGRYYPRSLRSHLLWELMMWRATRGASRIVCATTAAGDELIRAFPRLRDRIAIVPAVAPAKLDRGDPSRVGFDGPYALVIASHRPHKRLDALAAAWRVGDSRVPLVLIGAGTERLHGPPSIHGFGFVSDAEVDAWLNGAACFVSASLVEGFGLPLLAAMTAGVPVVAARHPALEEVGGDAVSWVEPGDVAGLVRAAQLLAVDSSTADARVRRGRQRAQTFTAVRAAQQLELALECAGG